MVRWCVFFGVIAATVGFAEVHQPDVVDRLKVGVQPDGRIVVPTNQILSPAGKQVTFPGRPVDIALAGPDTIVVKNLSGLDFINYRTGEVTQTLKSSKPLSAAGLFVQDKTLLVTDAENLIRMAERNDDGIWAWTGSVTVKKPAKGVPYPTGIVRLNNNELAVASNRGNTIQILDVETNSPIGQVTTGVAPFAIVAVRDDTLFVSNWGGDIPAEGDPRAPSSGTDVRVDPRTRVANHGSVTILKKSNDEWRTIKSIEVGLHPSGIIVSPDKKYVFVANACSDTVSVIDVAKEAVIETILCRPTARLPFGSGTNALAINSAGTTLYAANGTNNCVAVIRLGRSSGGDASAPSASEMQGLIPVGWFPGGVVLSPDGTTLCVANVKGHGSVSQPRPIEKGKQSKDHLGSVSIIPIPDAATLASYTKTVNDNNRLAYSLAGLEKPRPDVKPVPVPHRHGEPSVIEHVIYVIKENRTYDQVFGDIKEGNGDPNLVMFGEEVTPNQHALARQFTLFDNFYCSGVLSADGHQWCNEAFVTDYLERAFGKFVRSYPYEGSDPLAFAPTGFLWDNALLHKKTFFNFGEFTRSRYEKTVTWSDMFAQAQLEKPTIRISVTPNIESLKPYTKAGYPGFVLTTPDIYRAKMFIKDLKEYEKKGSFPNLVYLYLPCNHTSGTRPGMPTPKAAVADNDLALGQCVEAMSKSKFWPKSCFFVVEDDPQNGFDHVDAHRTIGLVISPYTRRKFVDSTCYNQTSMVKTMELILGLPPMNQLDLSAIPFRACFMDQPDLAPFVCLPNRIPLNQLNPKLDELKGKDKILAEKSLALDLDEADKADEDTFNRILWHAVRGHDAPYPERFAGRKEQDDDDN